MPLGYSMIRPRPTACQSWTIGMLFAPSSDPVEMRRPLRLRDKAVAQQRQMRGGEGGIRTPGTVTRTPHFECGAFNHSATSPSLDIIKKLGSVLLRCYGNLLLNVPSPV